MAWTGLKLTNFGRAVKLKTDAGKTMHITRVALGDGLIGSGNILTLTALVSEKMSVLPDAIRISDTTASIISQITNSGLAAGFYWNEMAIYCQDPDTQVEGPYVYDTYGEQGEWIGASTDPVPIYFYLRQRLTVSAEATITFDASGNPLYLPLDGGTMTGKLTLPAATTDVAPLNIPLGVAPSSPEVGDFWLDANGYLWVRRAQGNRQFWDSGIAGTVSQTDAEAGTSESLKIWSPLRVAQAIAAQAAGKSVSATATLAAASWTGSSVPYSYTYSNANILSATTPVELLPGDGITTAQLEALQGANIIGGTQAAGSITLLAYGDKPTIDIPVKFIFRGDL